MYTSAAFPDIAFENDRARLFADYWASLPKIDLVPMRSAFDPADVPNLLQTCEIHELVRPGVVLVRLSGSDMANRYSGDITGKNYLDIVDPSRRDKVWRALSHIVNHPSAMCVRIRNVRASGLVTDAEAVGFPFRGADGRATQIIYQSNINNPKELWDYRQDTRKMSRALGRTYIDIGAGVPDWDPAEDEE